uniref:Uncharacterized protein n=1 Tax=Sus scrofa TaxID=9823 RepID=A0A4X1UT59_PIG
MAALVDSQEPPHVLSPVGLESPGTPGAQLHGQQHGFPVCSPEVPSQLPDLDLQDEQEDQIAGDTCLPGE